MIVENIQIPAEVEPNTLFNVAWTIKNQGSRPTNSAFNYKTYFSFDQTIGNADDLELAYQGAPALGANESIDYSFDFRLATLPARPSSDSLFYIKVDTTNLIFESESNQPAEQNNTASKTVRFEYRVPDLNVQTAAAPLEVETDAEFAVNWTTTNTGAKNTVGFNERVYFSADNQIGNDTEIGSFAFPNGLAAGETISRSQNVQIPTNAMTATNDYFVYVRTDADNQVDEGNLENNNARFQLLRVRRALRPDLTVTNITAPATAFFDSTITVQYAIKNAGAGATNVPNWTDKIFLGTNQTLNGAQPVAQLTSVSALNQNETYIASATFRIPRGLSGSYFVIVAADADSQAREENETNNLATRAITINVPPLPDLRVSNVQAPEEAFAGTQISLNWTVTNNSTGATLPGENEWFDSVYLSRDATFGGDDRYIGNRKRIGALAQNASYVASGATINLPADAFGNYYVFVVADSNSSVYEYTAENNNSDYDRVQPGSPLIVRATPPDLVVLNQIAAPATASGGAQIAVSFTVKNQGAFDAAGAWRENVYLSADQTFNANEDQLLGSFVRANLPAGQQYAATVNATLPNCLNGTFYLFAVTDANNNIAEFDPNGNGETNNASQPKQIQLATSAPDLRVANVQVPAAAFAGSQMSVQFTIQNSGAGATAQTNWADRVILLANGGAIVLGDLPHAGALAVNQNYTQNQSVTIPAQLEGEFSLAVQTDVYNGVPECQFEDNNTGNSATFAVDNDLPDLRIADLAATPAAAELGATFNVQWTGINAGSGLAAQSWIDRVYLSSDATLDRGDREIGAQIQSRALGANESYAASNVAVTIPQAPLGNYFLIVGADAANNVNEGNQENNNASVARPITLGAPQVDLLASSVQTNPVLYSGQNSNVGWTIQNTGANPTIAQNWTDYIILSRDAVYDQTDRVIGYQTCNSVLAGGASYAPNVSVFIPAGLTGEYNIFVVADRNNNVAEASETNNISEPRRVLLELAPPAELNVTNVAVPANFTLGSAANFQWTVQNSSANAANGLWTDSVYLSTDAVWDSGDALVGQNAHAGSLSANATYTETLVVRNPNNQTARLDNGFQIVSGGGYQLRSSVVGPGETRGGNTRYYFNASNDGLNDAFNVPIFIAMPAAYAYSLDRSNYREFPTSELPPDADPTQLSLDTVKDGVRIIMLYAPILRAGATIKVGVDIAIPANFSGFEVIIQTLPPLEEFARAFTVLDEAGNRVLRAPNAVSAPNAAATNERDCRLELFRQALFAVLGALPGADAAECISAGWSTLLASADLVSALTLKAATGGSISTMDGVSGLVGKLLSTASAIFNDCGRQFPALKWISLTYTLATLLVQLYDCLTQQRDRLVIRRPPSIDPNEKISPIGFGPERFVGVQNPLLYRINFENLTSAEAPAQRVRIVDKLPATLDARTVRLLEIGFKQNRIVVPENRAFYQTRLQLGADLNNLQDDVSAGLDIATGTVMWTLTAIDPATNEQPINPRVGLLPPNNQNRDGEGYVIFTAQPRADQPTRTDLRNAATIYFDDNEPIATNTTTNLLDADVPTSQCAQLPATSRRSQ